MKNTLKKLGAAFAVLILMFSLAACGTSGTGSSSADSGASSIPPSESTSGNTAASGAAGSEAIGSAAPTEQTEGSNTLVAYFSLAGEQYGVGVIEEGNTSIIAHMIAEQTGADLFEIEAVTPYPQTHSELLDVSREEMANNARPDIAGTVNNIDDYDTIFIGYPNWWGDMPMIVYNFLESYDFSGKTIVPFCTHGGSGLSGTESTIADITGGTMKDGFAIAGTTAQNDREQSREEVAEWLLEGGFIE